jgi:hypothetical protein
LLHQISLAMATRHIFLAATPKHYCRRFIPSPPKPFS